MSALGGMKDEESSASSTKEERYVRRRTSEPSSEISGMDEPSITECRREELEVSSKIEDKMDAMMM